MKNTEINKHSQNLRVLVIDDNLSIREDFHKILQPGTEAQGLEEARASLFGGEPLLKVLVRFELDYADQGKAALALVQMASREGRPYALVFVDMRMPPGWARDHRAYMGG